MITSCKRIVLFIVATLFLILTKTDVSAQKDTSEKNVLIIVPTNPSLSEGRKLEITPQISRNNTMPPSTFSYSVIDKFSQTSKEINLMPPVAFFPDHKLLLPNGLVHLGYGNLNAINGGVVLNNYSNPNNAYGGNYNHYSTNIPNSNKDYSRNEVGAFAKIFSGKEEFGVSFDFSRDVLHYFNLPDSIENIVSKKEVKRYMEMWSINTYYKFGNINYMGKRPYFRTDLNFERFNMTGNVYENSFQAKGHMRLEHESFIKQGDIQPLDVKLSTNIDQLRYSASNVYNRYFVWFKASEEFSFDLGRKVIQSRIGFNFDVYGDSLEPKAYITPDIYVTLPLITKKVQLFLGVDGGLEKQGLKTLFSFNPFIQDRPLLENKFTSLSAYGGVDVNIAPGTVFLIEVSSAQVNDMPLFVGSDDSYRRFDVIYDNGVHTFVRGQLNYNLGDKIWSNISATYNNYQMAKSDMAWLYPDFEVKFSTHYTLSKKLFTNIDLISLGSRTALDENLNRIHLNPLIDINLGAEYILSNGFLAFIQLNNLAGTMYQRWYQFPVYGFNATAGIGYKF